MKKRTLSFLLALSLCITALPLLALPAVAAETEDTWNPVFRFVLVSDEHIDAAPGGNTINNNGSRLPNMMQAAYGIAKGGVPLSALVLAGDSVSAGYPLEYTTLVDRLNEVQGKNDDSLPLYAILGNHEYNNGYFRGLNSTAKNYAYAGSIAYDGQNEEAVLAGLRAAFTEKLSGVLTNTDVNYRATIGTGENAYSLILVSVDDYNGTMKESTLTWLSENLAAAAVATPDKPIFLICHYALKDTVTASNSTASYIPESDDLRAVLAKYPQVIMASGHTHRSSFLPRTAYAAENGFSAMSIPSLAENREFYMVEADANGTVRFTPYSLNGTQAQPLIGPDGKAVYYAFSYAGKTPVNQVYTDAYRATLVPAFAADATPTVGQLSAVGSLVTGTLRIPQALAGATPADSFTVEWKDADGETNTRTVPADVWRSSPADVVTSISMTQGKTYTVTVTPVSAYNVPGQALSVTLETPTATETKIPFTYSSSYALGGTNGPTFDGTNNTITFHDGWQMGVYKDEILTLNKYENYTGWNSTFGNVWDRGGYHHQDKTAVLPFDAGRGVLWQGYRAEYAGYLTFTAAGMKVGGNNGMGDIGYAIVNLRSGEVLWPTAAGATFAPTSYSASNTAWCTLPSGETLAEIRVNARVEAGDIIAFVATKGADFNAWGYQGLSLSVAYSDMIKKELTLSTDRFVQVGGGDNFPAVTPVGDTAYGGIAFRNNFTAGAYQNGNYTPYAWSNHERFGLSESSSLWGADGGLFYTDKSFDGTKANAPFVLPSGKSNSAAIVWTAPRAGVVRFDLRNMQTAKSGQVWVVVRNFSELLSGKGDFTGAYDAATWLECPVDTSVTYRLNEIEVKEGDTIALLLNRGANTDGWGMYGIDLAVSYTAYATRTTRVRSVQNDLLPDIKKTGEGQTLATSSSWSVVGYTSAENIGTDNIIAPVKRVSHHLVPASVSDINAAEIAISNGAWVEAYGPAGAFALKSGKIGGYRYTARESGIANLRFDELSGGHGQWFAGGETVAYAIYVNGSKIWPAGNDWFSITYTAENRKTNYADIINTYLPNDLYLAQGDRVEFLATMKTSGVYIYQGSGYVHLPRLDYTAVAQRTAVMDAALGVRFLPAGGERITAATIGGAAAAVTESGNGYLLSGILPVNMTETIVLTWQAPDTVYEGVTITHAAYTEELSYAGLLMDYINAYRASTDAFGQAVYRLAVATLNYGAAAQKRFAPEKTVLPDAGLTDAEKALALGSTADALTLAGDETAYTFRGASCVLRDCVQIKLYLLANTPDAGARLAYWADDGVKKYLDLEGEAGTTMNAYLDVLPTAYASIWHFRVEDADGKALSAEMTYSISSYAARMPAEADIAGRLITMGAAAEAYAAAARAAENA